MEAALEATGLYYIYRQKDLETIALRGAKLSLEQGSWTSLVGPSGSGKSTLLQVLAGLLEPHGGSVMAGGQDITRLAQAERDQWRRNNVGLVLQRDNLHPLLDVEENVSLPLRLQGRPKSHIRERVAMLIEKVGLTDRRRHRVSQLSGGEAQRVALAIAMAAAPPVLLADEPTGELDEGTASRVLELLAGYRKDEGAALMTVTHNPAIARLADRRMAMKDGEVFDVR